MKCEARPIVEMVAQNIRDNCLGQTLGTVHSRSTVLRAETPPRASDKAVIQSWASVIGIASSLLAAGSAKGVPRPLWELTLADLTFVPANTTY